MEENEKTARFLTWLFALELSCQIYQSHQLVVWEHCMPKKFEKQKWLFYGRDKQNKKVEKLTQCPKSWKQRYHTCELHHNLDIKIQVFAGAKASEEWYVNLSSRGKCVNCIMPTHENTNILEFLNYTHPKVEIIHISYVASTLKDFYRWCTVLWGIDNNQPNFQSDSSLSSSSMLTQKVMLLYFVKYCVLPPS